MGTKHESDELRDEIGIAVYPFLFVISDDADVKIKFRTMEFSQSNHLHDQGNGKFYRHLQLDLPLARGRR